MSETAHNDDSTEYDLSTDNLHEKPIDVTEVSGGPNGNSVHVKETFADGSYSTNIYTEEQGRKLFDRLKEIYDDN
jgi:hypothetical protein